MNPKLDQSESLPAQDGPGKCHCQPALYMLSIKYNDYLQYSDLSKFETVPIKGRASLVLIAQSRNKSFLRPSVYAARHGEQATDSRQLWAFNWSRLRYGARCLSGEERDGVKQRILRSSQGLLPSRSVSLLSSQAGTGPRLQIAASANRQGFTAWE